MYHHAQMLASAAYGALCMRSDPDAKELVQRAMPIARRPGASVHRRTLLHGNAGLAALLTGDTDAAHEAFREELRLCRETVDLPFASEGFIGLAAVAAVHGDADRAARLAGASDAHRYGQTYDAIEARLDTTFFQPTGASCGIDVWNAAAEEGAAMSFEIAIAYALR